MALVLPLSVKAQIQTKEKVRFLALGDSYTIGQSVAVSERWPVQLIDSLREKGISCYDPQIIATTGWRTDNLKAAIESTNFSGSYNLVSLLIGVNNYYQGKSVASYSPEFTELLDIAIDLAGGDKSHVFVVSIPDYGYTPFGQGNQSTISQGIDSYNAANKFLTGTKGVTYINITGISREGLARPELVASDGLHPSGKMYTEWVELILDKLSVQDVVTATERDESSSIKIYPNPTHTNMTIENLPGSEKNFRIIFRNGAGKTSFHTGIISETRKVVISIEDLTPGTYFYELSGKASVLKTGKLIKQ